MRLRYSHANSLVLLLILLAINNAAYSQKPTPTPERDRQIVSLLSNAQLAAPELAADTFLKVAASKRVAEEAWQKEILEEASRSISQVKYPVRKQIALFGVQIDSVTGYMTYAYDQKLDAISLKSRLIKQWLSVDKERARQIVFEIGGNLDLKPLTCEDSLVYDVEDIYAAVGDVAKIAFSKKEIDEGVRSLYLLPWIENIQSPAQLGPALKLVRSLAGPSSERQILVNAFLRVINRNFHDDRSFSWALAGDRILSDIFSYASFYSVNEKVDIRPTVREFLAKNLIADRCLDNKSDYSKIGELPALVRSTNEYLDGDLKPFISEDFSSVEYKGVPEMRYYLRSKMAVKFDRTFRPARDIKNAPDKKGDLTAQEDWKSKVAQMLEDLNSWNESDEETEIEVFNQKCVAFGFLIRETSEGPLKTHVARNYIRFLAGSSVQRTSFIEWLFYVRGFALNESKLFEQMAAENPNPNFKAIIEVRKFDTSTVAKPQVKP
jgi:hypothetical protein